MEIFYPPTIVIRHKKENLKKCSLRGLEGRQDFVFFRYPLVETLPYADYLLLSVGAEEELAPSDQTCGLLILDATWKYAEQMHHKLPNIGSLKLRRLPPKLVTAYPRRQQDCSDPGSGLASIEAIFCAYTILGRSTEGLLDQYYWRDSFLEKNNAFLLEWSYYHERKTQALSTT